MSEMLSNIRSETNQTDTKLSSIKQVLSQMKQSVRINYLHKGSMNGIVDTPANIQVSGGQEPQSRDDAVCGLNKADMTCDTNKPINDSRVDNTVSQLQQLFLESCRKSNSIWLHALMQSDCSYSSLLFEHYNRILLCE